MRRYIPAYIHPAICVYVEHRNATVSIKIYSPRVGEEVSKASSKWKRIITLILFNVNKCKFHLLSVFAFVLSASPYCGLGRELKKLRS